MKEHRDNRTAGLFSPPGTSRHLVFTALAAGALIMAPALIGPPLGVSLFVWTSLVTITMAALAPAGARLSGNGDLPIDSAGIGLQHGAGVTASLYLTLKEVSRGAAIHAFTYGCNPVGFNGPRAIEALRYRTVPPLTWE